MASLHHLLVHLALAAPACAFAAELHVAPAGRDEHPGTAEQPFLTLARARDAARGHSGAVVRVHGGDYFLDAPLELTPDDSGLTIRAAGDGLPVFHGGRALTGWTPGSNGVWTARVPEIGGKPWRFDQLFVNGRRAVRARAPNGTFAFMRSVSEVVVEEGGGRVAKSARQAIGLAPEDFAPLAGLSEREQADVCLVAFHKWDNTRMSVAGVNAETRELRFEGGGMKSWNKLQPGTRFFLENFRAALDHPGEWFLDRDGRVHYHPRPGEDMAAARVFAPVLDRFVVLRGDRAAGRRVKGVTLSGLAFRHAASPSDISDFPAAQAAAGIEAVVMADDAEGIVLEDCEISRFGGYGAWFRAGCRDCVVRRNLIEDSGAGGVRIGTMSLPDTPEAETAGIQVEDNIIRHGGRIYPCAVGVWIGFSPSNRIAHNHIADHLYTGISVGWRWGYNHSNAKNNLVEFNRVSHIGQGVLSDMGGIYTLGRSEGTVVRNNVFHDIHSYSYGGWGLYTDEGSTGILFENNLVYNTKSGGFHQHYGRENIVRNNILAFALDQQVQASRAEDHLSYTLENNLIAYDQGALLKLHQEHIRREERNNIVWFAGDAAEAPKEAVPFAQWRATPETAAPFILADPGFRDPAARDFTLPPDSPALAAGFKPFDPSLAGVRGTDAWRRRARETRIEPPLPPAELPPGVPHAP